jgi:hypothetical protein
MATKDEMMCEYIIEEMKMEKNEDKMRKCYRELIKISKKFPPQKNENKFIYGKLGEKALISMLQNLGIINIVDLDNLHSIGSEYKNDIIINDVYFSIKVKLNRSGGDIIMINCKSTSEHTLDINTLVIVINERKIYAIPKTFNSTEYIKQDSGSISYKSKILTHFTKEYPQYIYTFPELVNEDNSDILAVDIYNILYNDYIKE